MSIKGCVQCARWSVFALNFVAWVVGMAVLFGSIYVRMDTSVKHIMTAAYSDDSRLFAVICYVAMAAGLIVTLVAFLGCCSAYQEARFMIIAFVTVLLLWFAVEILAGVWIFLNLQKAQSSIPSTMQRYVMDVYGKSPNSVEPIDFVQQSLQCCGGRGPTDWASSSWTNRTSHSSLSQQFLVPDSCCTRRPTTVSTASYPPGGAVCQDEHKVVLQKDCGSELSRRTSFWLMYIVAIPGISLLLIQFLSLLLSVILCCGMRRQAAGGYKS